MPAYYDLNSISPANAAAVGAAVGFDLFDRAIARREEIEANKRRLAQEDERLRMAREDQAMQAERFSMERQDRQYNNDQTYAQNAGAAYSEYAAQHGVDDTKWSPEARTQAAAAIRSANPSLKNADDDTVLRTARGHSQFVQQDAVTERKRDEVTQGLVDKATLSQELQAPDTGMPAGQTAGGGPRRGGPRGLRNNNPGNIRATNIAWQGKVGNDGEFEQFATPEDGLRAASRNLITGAKQGANTIRSAITRWAPPIENDTGGYIERVASALGVDPDAPLDFADPQINAAVLEQIVAHENGAQPFDKAQLLNAATAATGAPVGNTPNVAQGSGSGVVAPPRSLRDIQLAKDANPEPGPLTTAFRAGQQAEANTRGKRFERALDANSNDPQVADFRRDGAKYAVEYANSRSGVAPEKRAALDEHVMTATAERLQQISAELYQGASGGKANRLIHEKDQLVAATERVKKERTAEAIDRMLPRSTPPGDKAAAAGQAAVDAAKQGPTKATPSEVKAGEATMDQWGKGEPKKRLTPDQIKRAARLVAIGVMSQEQFDSFTQYGTFDKPEKPTFINIGNGLVGVWDERSGYRVIDHSKQYAIAERAAKSGGGVGPNGMTAPEVRARAEQNWKNGFDYIKAAADKLDDDLSPTEHMGRFMQFITRFAPQIEARKGYQLTDPYTGEVTLGLVDPGQFNDLVDGYTKFANEELDAWFPDGKGYPDYLSAPDAKGWSIRPAGK